MANEKRLISVDNAISHYKALANIAWNEKVAPVSWKEAFEEFIEYLEEAPTVDAVEVVRCKDCRYAYINFFSANSGVALCRHWTNHAEGKQAITQHDDFCSYGERREGE